MASPPNTLSDRILAFSLETSTELSQQQDLLEKLKGEGVHRFRKTLMPLALMLLVSLLIVLYPKALILWFIVGLFLYSYNFILLLMPTTSERARPKEKGSTTRKGSDERWPAFKLFLHKRKLAVEMALTLFLGRMVPLTASFTAILGLGMGMLVYFLLTGYTAATGLSRLLLVQVLLIMVFYVLVNFLRPQAQGITTLARSWKRRLGAARSRGRGAIVLVRSAVVGVIAISIILAIGAMMLPGVTFFTLLTSLRDFNAYDLLLIVGLFAVQLWVMRVLQSLMSRRMAVQLLHVRIDKLQQLLEMAERLMSSEEDQFDRGEGLKILLSEYYSMMVYDIFRQDLFGRAPVYLVGPRLKYMLDEKVLQHIPG